MQDSLAELFSIIVTLDELEKAFLKDAIPEAEYTDICERSLRQYKALLTDETIAKEFGGLEEFKAKWDVRKVPCTLINLRNFANSIAAGGTACYRTITSRPSLDYHHSWLCCADIDTPDSRPVQHERCAHP